jgi:phthalate 4,5-dioxygenase oxygenase subunit
VLSAAENDRLCRIEGAAPMGRMLRRYWLPACLSAEVAEPGSRARIRLMGEDLIAERTATGVRIGAHPVRDAGGIVWTYLDPGEPPPLPAYDWTALPAEQRTVMRAAEHANFAQAIEGSIDSAHSWFLHRGAVRDWRLRSGISSDESPRIEAEDTAYGFRYAAIRKVDANPENERYIRTTHFAMPFISFIPRPMNLGLPGHIQIFAPVDDERTMFYGVWFSQNGMPIDREATLAEVGFRPGVDLEPVTYARYQTAENWWQQDRAAMRSGTSFTGVSGVLQQDMAVQESMGPLVDRTREHLGTSDVAIIRMRRRLLDALERFESDGSVIAQRPGIPFERIRSEQKVIPVAQPWRSVGAYAGEYDAGPAVV